MFYRNPVVKNVPEGMSYDEMMEWAGLNFVPEKRALTYMVDGVEYVSSLAVAICKDQYELGICGPKYGILPFDLSFSVVEHLSYKNEAKPKAVAVIGHGSKAFITLETDDAIDLGAGMKIRNTFLLMSSHDGSCKVTGKSIPYCEKNGSILPIPGSDFNLKVKHTVNAESKLVDAKRTMKSVQAAWLESEPVFRQATGVMIDNDEAVNYLSGVFGPAESTRMENIFANILDRFHGGSLTSTLLPCRGTLFGLYMAVVDYCDTDKTVRNSKKVDADEARFLASVTGEAAKQKAEAFGTMFRMMNGDY